MLLADAISAKAHMCAAHVKAAVAAGRSQNKVREAVGIVALGVAETEEE